MLNKDYTTELLNLEDVIVANVENRADAVHIFLELPRTQHHCPACGALTDRVHDYRMQTIKDMSHWAEKPSCICASAAIAVSAASASLRRTPS